MVQEERHTNGERPFAVAHVDLDGASHIYAHHGWSYGYEDDPLYESGFRSLLAFLKRNEIKATLFAVASDLDNDRRRLLLEQAVREGHEIASHSMTHPTFTALRLDQKRYEIAESRRRLESALETPVTGFRVPNYHVDRDCLDLMDECGYAFDSSTFPTPDFAVSLELPILPQAPHRPLADRSLMEIPLPQYRPAPFPFSPSYSLILGIRYFNWGLRRFRRTGQPLVLLFHLADFSDPLPKERLRGWKSRFFTLSHVSAGTKMQRCQTMLDQVRRRYEMTDTSRLLDQQNERLTREKRWMLAISTTHETGAAIFEGSQVKAAISEERLDRIKFSTRYPPRHSIEEVIRAAGVDPADIQDVVISGLPAHRLIGRMLRGQLRDVFEFHGLNDYFPHGCKVLYRGFYFYRAMGYRSLLKFLRKRYGIRPRLHFIEHHLCHAAAAYRTAPFDDALIVTADGVGDDLSLTISLGRNGRIERLNEIPYPHSFGQFYTACTQVLGFRGGRHEGKITGLSGFGRCDPELYRKVKATIRKSGPGFTLDKRYYSEGIIRGFSPTKLWRGESLFDALEYRNYKKPLKKLLAGAAREDVAAVFQQLLEEEMVQIVRPFAEQTGARNLAMCGGVFANVKLNARLFRDLGFDNAYIFPHMGDGGLSIGAALEMLQIRPSPFDSVYWGADVSQEQMESALRAASDQGLSYRREENIEKTVAGLLVKHKVIARFNGRMEFGPRALGNRSILYHAGDPGANKWLNERLRRTEFMPFAPIVMMEKAPNLFDDIRGTEHACKFMTIILNCNEFTKKNCPAIVHVDGTARPQFVSEDINPSMYHILKEYHELTGIPLLVNTSFNMHEEPIVCTPEDAVRAYLSSRLDFLAMGPFLAWPD